MQITRLGPIGAEITGVDVKTMDDAAFDRIYQAWLDNNVICVRDQDLEIEDYLNYSRRFGYVCPHPSKSTRHESYPEITVLGINKFNTDGTINKEIYARGGEGFHTDGSYDPVPFKATQLYAVAIPSRGGDTLFSSAYVGYEDLSPEMRQRLEGKQGEYIYGGRKKRNLLLNEEDRHEKPVLHPLIREHPETKRKLLYFDQNKILGINGMAQAESDAIIDELAQYMVEPPKQYRHKWRKGDIVIWDNRCSYHKAAADYPPEEDRIHWRVSIKEYSDPR